ncbi:MAG: helix-turn-helix transcriptional regulator [Gammaproteobacteria bacterium]|nr:helix-turn-helix transcriptional regulator [Gammaproteobacteria bacterium]MBU1654439.1 helix-turn-helix transcriptional regulator [Gammaproteobacteria bacterium]MBU1960749.1 helix-turn-helix transcriptional regulator [Gammaproteobacteria bacterium]
MNTQAQIIERDGKPEYAVLPYDFYRHLLELAEDAEDIAAADAAKRELMAGDDELIPAEVADALVDGENPIKVWRKFRGLSQMELGEAIGKKQGYIAQLEAGKRSGSIEVYRAMAAVLRVEIDDLIVVSTDS